MPEDSYAYVVATFQASPSLDYVSGPEHPPSPVYVPEFVPQPVYLEFMPAEDEILLAKEEPLHAAASPTTESPAVDHAPSAEETEPFETDESATTPPPHPSYRVTARMSIRPQTPISLPADTKIARLMAIPTPPPLPLSSLSSPLPQIPSPPLPLLSPQPTDPTYDEVPLGYREARLRLSAEGGEILEADMPLRKRVNRLFRDRRYHAHTASLMEGEARASRTAWAQSMDSSYAAHYSRDTAGGDQGVVGSRPQATGTDCAEVMSDSADCSSRTDLDLSGRQKWHQKEPPEPTPPLQQPPPLLLNTNDDDNHVLGTSAKRTERVTHECAYPDFMKCQSLNFKGTERVVELTQWFEKIETVFCISNCSMENQIKFPTCTLLGSALTWWNSHVITIGPDFAYAMTWVDLKKMILTSTARGAR
nr:reverse transcriptase domain-containing protein [Tanacetum cinerariifolium]